MKNDGIPGGTDTSAGADAERGPDRGPDRGAGIQVIARAAAIMRVVGEHPQGLSLSVIAGHVGLARSTVQRIIHALEVEGFVEPAGPGGGFRLGPSLSRLVYRRQADIVTEVRPTLEALCSELGESMALCGLTGEQTTTLDRAIAERPLRVVFPLGTIPHPAHSLAPGRAMLAEWPEDRQRALLARSLPPGTDAPSLDRALAELQGERDAARDRDVFIEGLTGLAVPLRTHMGLYALACVLPTVRAQAKAEEILTILRQHRDRLEAAVGTR